MKKKTILLPLSKQFTIVLIIFSICTAGITVYSTFGYARTQADMLDKTLESYSAQLAKSTLETYQSYENICYSIACNQTVQDYLNPYTSPASAEEPYQQYQQLYNLLTNTANLNPYIMDIAVYGQDGSFVSLCGSVSNYQAFTDTLSELRFPYCSAGTAVINRVSCHIMTMPIYTLRTGESRYLGLMFLAVDVNSLFGNNLIRQQNDYHPIVVFTDSENQMVYGDPALYEKLMGTSAKDQVFQIDTAPQITYAVTRYTLPKINHTLYVLVDRSQFTHQIIQVSLRLILSMSALILLILILLLLLYRPMIHSLKQLTEFMRSITDGNQKVKKQGLAISQGCIGSSEIAEIFQAFNDMLAESNRLNHTIFNTYTKMYELEADNRKTEIAFLRSQINPHFLYNTLTMICGMAAENNTDKIISVTGALSQLFRYSIKGSDLVTLREEMEIVQSYLLIQKERFADRFTIRYEFSEDSMDCLIPKMVIQPLVENAIVHGLEKRIGSGELLIGAGRNPRFGYLAIWIYDTGVGMPVSKLRELQNVISQSASQEAGDASANLTQMDAENHDSIGILNVNRRMVLHYGTAYTLLLDSEEGVGTNIQIRVPHQIPTSESEI